MQTEEFVVRKVKPFFKSVRLEGPKTEEDTLIRENFMRRMDFVGISRDLIDDLDGPARSRITNAYDRFQNQQSEAKARVSHIRGTEGFKVKTFCNVLRIEGPKTEHDTQIRERFMCRMDDLGIARETIDDLTEKQRKAVNIAHTHLPLESTSSPTPAPAAVVEKKVAPYKVKTFFSGVRVEGPKPKLEANAREKFMRRMECLGLPRTSVDDLSPEERTLVNDQYEVFKTEKAELWKSTKESVARMAVQNGNVLLWDAPVPLKTVLKPALLEKKKEIVVTIDPVDVKVAERSAPVTKYEFLSKEDISQVNKARKKLGMNPASGSQLVKIKLGDKEKLQKAVRVQTAMRFLGMNTPSGEKIFAMDETSMDSILYRSKAKKKQAVSGVNKKQALKDAETVVISKGTKIGGVLRKKNKTATLPQVTGKSVLLPQDFIGSKAPQRAKRAYVAMDNTPRKDAVVCPHPLKSTFVTKNSAWTFIAKNYSTDKMIHPYSCRCGAIHIGHAKTKG